LLNAIRNDKHAVAYLGYDRHGWCHGRRLLGRQYCLAKSKTVCWTYFATHITINRKVASKQLPYLMHESGVYRQHHQAFNKTVVLWHNTTVKHCDRTRTLASHIYWTTRPPHAIRKAIDGKQLYTRRF